MIKTYSDKAGFWVRVGAFLQDHGLTVSLVVVPLLMSLAGYLLSDEVIGVLGVDESWKPHVQFWALIALVILMIVHIVLAIFHICAERRHTKLLSDLEKEKATRELVVSNAKALCDGFLQELARGPLGFGSKEANTERITLYVHDKESGFQPIGRFSFNQSYIKKGRSFYPENEGCIGKAWEHGWKFEKLPDSSTDLDGWVDHCHKLGVPKGVARAMNMQSSLYCACTVRNGQTTCPVAVVVVESTDTQRYEQQELRDVLTDDRRAYIARMVEMLHPWLGDPDDAKERGY